MISDIRVFSATMTTSDSSVKGPCRLLHLIERRPVRCGLRRSPMGMAYTKALAIMKRAEKISASAHCPPDRRKGGGGSALTPEAKGVLHDYETYRDACIQSSRGSILRSFSKYTADGSSGNQSDPDSTSPIPIGENDI